MFTGIYLRGAGGEVGGLPAAIVGTVAEWASLVSQESLGVSARLFEYDPYVNDERGEQQLM